MTVFTHGWQYSPGTPAWLTNMADFIGYRASEALIPGDHMGYAWYHATITDEGILVTDPQLTGFSKGRPTTPDLDDFRSGEVIVTVDWSDVANHLNHSGDKVTTDEIAVLMLPILTNTYTSQGISHPLAELPIHLIGHSRGGSVVAELARLLGERGFWVEQVTTLDPHPLHWPDAGLVVPDPAIELTRNILYADNFWRQDSGPISAFDFNGQPVGTARNLQLDELLLGGDEVLNDPGYQAEHSDVHLWYFGTVATTPPDWDGEEGVPDEWFSSQQERETSGFYFSRIGGGAAQRSSAGFTFAHYPPSGDVPPLVLTRPLPANVGLQRANIDHLELISHYSTAIEIGGSMAVRFHYQDRDSGVTLNWHLDPDTNPYNGNETLLSSSNMSATGDSVLLRTNAVPVPPGVTEGRYFVFAEIIGDNDGYKRYDYLPDRLAFSNSPPPVPTPAIASVNPTNLPGLPLPQTQPFAITGTGFLPQSKLEFSDGTTTYPNRVPIYDSPTQLRYNIKVGNVSANWTVKVLNGSLESNPASFTVTATPDTTAPPAPIAPVGYFAGGVGNDFYYVDWTDPADASGPAKIWWKLGSPPTAPNDGIGFALPDLKPLPVSTLTTNPQTLYLWLEDGAGNKDHNQRSSVLLFPTIGAPFVVTPPPDRSVIEGASAVFSVTAGGAAPLGYQWQKNGVPPSAIPGATLPTYITPPVTLADSGAQFRVIITNAFGAVTSSWATLTVNPANPITWTGAVSSDWNNPTNWLPQTVPTASVSVVINSGYVNAWQASFAVMDLNGGNLGGTFTNVGTLNWSSGGLLGQMVNATGAVLAMQGGGDKIFYNQSAQVRNDGLMIWSGAGRLLTSGDSYYGPIPFENRAGGVWEIQGDSQTGSAGGNYPVSFVFTNRGVMRKTGDVGTTTFSWCSFNNLGTVDVQSGTLSFINGYSQTSGSTILGGTSLSALSSIYLNGGTLSGSGLINGSVVNAAEISPGGSPGTITIVGSYTQTAAGRLAVEIGGLSPGSQHDQLVVTGPATLDGALQVSFTNGFAPQPGDFFNVLSCASRSGAFAASNAGLLGLTESYTPTGLLLIAGSNAYPSLSFTVSGGNTQTVCVPFQLQAAAADVDGALTNVTILLDGSPLAGAGGSPVVTRAELDFPARYTFTARAQDDQGGTSWATQEVAVMSWPLHWLLPAGLRTNGLPAGGQGAFKLCLLGETNRSYELQASTNLSETNWLPIGVMENTNGIWRFLDTGATNRAWQFYRAVQMP